MRVPTSQPRPRLQLPQRPATRQFVFDQPGIYSFYCPVGNGSHQNLGMIGMLRMEGPPDGGEPTIALAAPTTDRELTGTTVLYAASITNFDIPEAATASGRVKLTLDGIDLGLVDHVIGALTNLAQGAYSLTAELANSNDSPLNPAVQSTITFTLDDETETPARNPALGVTPIADRSPMVVEPIPHSPASEKRSVSI